MSRTETASILVVEDDSGIRTLLQRGLRLAGHRVTFAENLAAARDLWSGRAWDVILLDVMMPDGDGIELLAEQRRNGDATPVLILSAREEAELHGRAVASGANAYLSKPFAYRELLASIDALTQRA